MNLQGVIELICGKEYVRTKFYRKNNKVVDSLYKLSHNNIGAVKNNIIEYKLFEEGDLLLAEPIRIIGNQFQL